MYMVGLHCNTKEQNGLWKVRNGDMARFIQDLVLNKPDDFVNFIMNDYLQKNQFTMSDWNGETAFRAGDAMMEGYKYLKWSYVNGVFHIEAWMKGMAGKELDLDGFVGTLQKKPYKESLEQLFAALQQPIPAPQQSAPMGGPQMGQPIPVNTVDNTKAANSAFIFGILSIALGFFVPLAGVIIACLGFSRARMGLGSSHGNKAKTGKILCIVGICVSVIMWVLNFVISMGMM